MDLSLSDEQEQLRTVVRDAMASLANNELLVAQQDKDTGYVARAWDQLCRAGLLALSIPENYGGAGASLSDAAVAMEQFGRGPLPQLYLVHATLIPFLFLGTADEAQKQYWLPQVAEGRVRITAALTEQNYGWTRQDIETELRTTSGGLRLSGQKVFVPDAAGATHALVSARISGTDRTTLVIVDLSQAGVGVEPIEGFVSWQSKLTFDGVSISAENVLGSRDQDAWPGIEAAVNQTIPLLCAFQVGSCQSVFDMSLEHSRTRIQFGQPIGRFQRVQDHVIELINNLDAARWSTYETIWKRENAPAQSQVALHLTKSIVSESHWEACNWAHEVHAGLGTDLQYGLAKHTHMSRNLYHFLGEPHWHRERMAAALGW